MAGAAHSVPPHLVHHHEQNVRPSRPLRKSISGHRGGRGRAEELATVEHGCKRISNGIGYPVSMSLTRRQFLAASAAAGTGILTAAESKPNILFILADD